MTAMQWLDLELSPIIDVTPSMCGEQPRTPAGFYPPLGGLPAYGAPDTGSPNVHYHVGGTSAPAVPDPDHTLDNWGFPIFGTPYVGLPAGFYDTAWSTGNAARSIAVGPGTMTILLVPGPEGNGPYDLTLACLDGVAEHVIETRTNQPISPTGITEVVVEIPAEVEGVEGDLICNFWVDIGGFYGGTRIVGYGGFNWEPA